MEDFTSLQAAAGRPELLAAGYTDHEIRRAVHAGQLVALGSGIVVPAGLLDGTPECRHRERSLAVARRSAGGRRDLAAASAAAVLGLPVWGLDTSRVVFAENGAEKSRTRTTGVMRVEIDRRPRSVVDVGDIRVSAPARVVVDIARTADRVPAIAVGDAALNAELCTMADLANELDLITGMAGAARARRIVAELDGRSESVLESRSRITILDSGLPAPDLQVDLFDAWGKWVARVDFYWRDRGVVGECDGAMKYAGPDGNARLRYEKRRSDAIRELDLLPIHWNWADVDEKDRLLARFARVLTQKPDRSSGTAGTVDGL